MGLSLRSDTAAGRIVLVLRADPERSWSVQELAEETGLPMRNAVTACSDLREGGHAIRLHSGRMMLRPAYPAMPVITPRRPADPLDAVRAFTL